MYNALSVITEEIEPLKQCQKREHNGRKIPRLRMLYFLEYELFWLMLQRFDRAFPLPTRANLEPRMPPAA
jgi:hypothetical protein